MMPANGSGASTGPIATHAAAATGTVVWLTGLPSAGKTTIAALVCERLRERGQPVEHLDGDEMRRQLCRELGFSREDRDENIHRIGYVARLLARHGVTVLVSVISPYRAAREKVRAQTDRFLEIYVATDLTTCRARDVKGLYARHARGELTGLTGIDDPYEPPLAPELVVHTEAEPPASSAERVLTLLTQWAENQEEAVVIGVQPTAEAVRASRSRLATPHGGRLVNLLVDPGRSATIAEEAGRLPTVVLDGWGVADLECLAVGAFSPLRGFHGAADYENVVTEGRLANGLVWTLPIVLSVPPELLRGGPDRLALASPDGQPLGVLDVAEVYRVDPLREATAVYRTDDLAHPGVAAVLRRPGPLVGGSVQVLRLPATPAGLGPRLTPAQTSAEATARGWRSMAGFQTRNPVHRAHEYLHKVVLEQIDGLLLHPLAGETKQDDVPAVLRMACYRALLEGYYPASRVLLSTFPAAMRYAGPREAIFHAIVRKNYGCTHFIVGRDHAGVGSFYGTYAAQEAFAAYDSTELGIVPLLFEHAFYCRRCDGMATTKTCPHPADQHVVLSGTAVRTLLARGQLPPREFSRPEVARLLADGYGGDTLSA